MDVESKSVPDLEEIGEERIPHRSNRSTILHRIRNIFIIVLAIWGTGDLGYRIYSTIKASKEISCNCGETIDEALANGCKYDSIAAAWLPVACRDDDLNAEFELAGPNPDGSWPYYADQNKTRTLSLEEVSMLPNTGGHFFTTHQWHLVHCAYYWKKMYKAAETGVTIEKRYDSLIHINHCEMMFLKRDPLDKMAAEAGVALHSDVAVVSKKMGQHKHDHHPHEHHEHHEGMDMSMYMDDDNEGEGEDY